MVSGLEERADQGVLRCHAGGEGEAVASALKRRQALLQSGAGGVAAAAVVVAGAQPRAQPADAVLGEGAGGVDGDVHGTGSRVRLLPGVDRVGVDPLVEVKPDHLHQGVVGDVVAVGFPEPAVGLRPVGGRGEALTFGLRELPGHVGETSALDPVDDDHAEPRPRVVDQHQALSRLLGRLVLGLVLLDQAGRRRLATGQHERVQLGAHRPRAAELQGAQVADSGKRHGRSRSPWRALRQVAEHRRPRQGCHRCREVRQADAVTNDPTATRRR